MATLKEQDIVLVDYDTDGNPIIQMPITRVENVEGAIKTINVTKPDASGNINLVDLVYPVGAIYMSAVATSPATLFGGSWEALDDGRVLIGANATYKAGTTGGEATHTLTTNEMPSHSHTGSATSTTTADHIHAFGDYNNNNGTFIGTSGSTTGVTLDSKAPYKRNWNGSGSDTTNTHVGTGSGAYQAELFTSKTVAASSGSTNSHSHTVTVGSTGGGQAHNNMQPYLSVYMWKRTA